MLKFAFVSAVGLVSAGLVSSLWSVLTGRAVSLGLLADRGLLLPLRVMVLVLSGPVLLIVTGFRQVCGPSGNVFKWWMTLPSAMGWSFVQGVVVVVTLSAIG